MSATSIIQAIKRLNNQITALSKKQSEAYKKEVDKEKQINDLAKRQAASKSLSTVQSIQNQIASKQKELIRIKDEKLKIDKQISGLKTQLFSEQDKLSKTQQQENQKSQKKELGFLKEKDRLNSRELSHIRQLNNELHHQQTLFEDYVVPQGDKEVQDEAFSIDELINLHKRIDSILEHLTKLGYGQEIIFDEIESLKNKAQKVSKKDLGLILVGQLVSYGSGLIEPSLAAEIYQKVNDIVLEKLIE
ncbi:hypothetical protein LZQ00_02575 [Sphingobacterium sp. SRCM116780]|uniref:hypothetical protein n=1 Tax=Sphingobacterium sp. SRCM116780 TaxID=2907623 RepID=UPI001F306F9E|nr:hypothetical protein [Sphingobacterium sp. SRCM116780]UIR56710.1 hypothetical protein LZQ00_02575 [Sphingobacterium sp. SRCM116780]